MATSLSNPIADMRTELQIVHRNWWQKALRRRTKVYRLFIMRYADGSYQIYKAKEPKL